MTRAPILCMGDAHTDFLIFTGKTGSLNNPGDDAPVVDFSQQVIPSPGGTSCNWSCALSHLGVKASFFGSMGRDPFARLAIEYMKEQGVDTSRIVFKDELCMMVFCLIDETGERDFRIYPTENFADILLRPEDIPEDIYDEIGMMTVSGVQLIHEPIRTTMLTMMETCRSKGIPIAFDLNLRLSNFAFTPAYREDLLYAISLSDIVFGSGMEELMPVTQKETLEEAAISLWAPGKIVVAKNGGEGAFVLTDREIIKMDAFPVDVADTVGAGDNFNSGFLAAYYDDLSVEDCLLWGCGAAAYSIQFSGGGNGPTRQQLLSFLQEHETEIHFFREDRRK